MTVSIEVTVKQPQSKEENISTGLRWVAEFISFYFSYKYLFTVSTNEF